MSIFISWKFSVYISREFWDKHLNCFLWCHLEKNIKNKMWLHCILYYQMTTKTRRAKKAPSLCISFDCYILHNTHKSNAPPCVLLTLYYQTRAKTRRLLFPHKEAYLPYHKPNDHQPNRTKTAPPYVIASDLFPPLCVYIYTTKSPPKPARLKFPPLTITKKPSSLNGSRGLYSHLIHYLSIICHFNCSCIV